MIPIKDFDKYYITTEGEVYSSKQKTLKKLKPVINQHGYLCVVLRKEGKSINKRIHRLVALAFIENPYNLLCVNHKDGDKLNNTVGNLEWCTNSENTLHAYKNNLINTRGILRPRRNLTDSEIILILQDYQAENISFGKLGSRYNLHHTQVSRIIRKFLLADLSVK